MIGFPRSQQNTRDALNPGALHEVLTGIHQANPDYRLVGSLGRAVLYGVYEDNPYHEFDERQEYPLLTNSLTTRDLDLINAPILPPLRRYYPVDTVWGHNTTAQITQAEDGTWYLQSKRHKFDAELHPDVMTPITGQTVYGVEAVTVPPQTHLALYAVRGALKHKDQKPLELLVELLHKTPLLPEKHYDPFYALREQQQKGIRAAISRARARISSK